LHAKGDELLCLKPKNLSDLIGKRTIRKLPTSGRGSIVNWRPRIGAKIVGTFGIERGEDTTELRRMYLDQQYRGVSLSACSGAQKIAPAASGSGH